MRKRRIDDGFAFWWRVKEPLFYLFACHILVEIDGLPHWSRVIRSLFKISIPTFVEVDDDGLGMADDLCSHCMRAWCSQGGQDRKKWKALHVFFLFQSIIQKINAINVTHHGAVSLERERTESLGVAAQIVHVVVDPMTVGLRANRSHLPPVLPGRSSDWQDYLFILSSRGGSRQHAALLPRGSRKVLPALPPGDEPLILVIRGKCPNGTGYGKGFHFRCPAAF